MDKILFMMQAMDALFPIGGYTLSNGLETYVQKNIVNDKESLYKYIQSYLYTLSYNDLAFAYRAYSGQDIKNLDELCSAIKSPYEVRSGSIKQCIRFIKAQKALKDCPLLNKYEEKINVRICDGHYSIAVGLFIKDIDLDINTGLLMYGYNILSTIVNHTVKLVPLRQLEGQKVLYDCMGGLTKSIDKAIKCSDDELGVSGVGFTIRSMQHEHLYSRLYIS